MSIPVGAKRKEEDNMAARLRGSMGRERALLCVYVKLLANQTGRLGKMRSTLA